MDHSTDIGRQRDAGAMRIVGWFFILLGGLVLLGTLWAGDNHRAMIVNACSGALLAAIGMGMIYFSYRSAAAAARRTPPIE